MTQSATQLGRYRLAGVLGSGGMAVVYAGYDTILDREVAVKVLADNLSADPAFRDRFLREARIAARVSHPNIVQVFDSGEEDGRPYIVMELVDGEPLRDLLDREGPLDPERVLGFARDACAALAAAHGAGLIHRDVKPQNLLVTGGRLKTADFGIAHVMDEARLTLTGSVLGSAGYLAPEQASGAPASPAADLYSLGVVLYEALTGRLPHTGRTLPELIQRAREEPVTPVRALAPSVPPALERAIMRCLAVDPSQRPASAADLAESLEGPGTTAAATIVMPPAARRHRRQWAAMATVAALAAMLVVLVVLALTGDSSRPAPRPPHVAPVPAAATPADRAAALARWISHHSR